MTTASDRPTRRRDEGTRQRKFDPSPRKGDRRREEILDCAEGLLGESSLLDLSFERIAKQSGLSRSSIYFYFDSKWAIVDALIARASREMLERTTGVSDDIEFDDFMTELSSASLDGWRRHRAVFLAAAERSSHADESTDRWRATMGEFVKVIAARIESELAVNPAIDVTAVGGPQRVAEIVCWMTERNLYMLFSREHTVAEEDALSDALGAAFRRILGLGV